MGALIDQLQKNERAYLSEKAKKQKEKEQKAIFENSIYKKVYNNFTTCKAQGMELEKIRSCLLDPFIKKDYLKGFNYLQYFYKSSKYDQIVNNIYKNFNIIYYEEKEKKKEIEKLQKLIEKEEKRGEKLQEKNSREHKKGLLKIGGALLIADRLAAKTKNKNKFYK